MEANAPVSADIMADYIAANNAQLAGMSTKNKVNQLRPLLNENPTPLLREEIRQLVDLYDNTRHLPDEECKDIDILLDRIDQHWRRINQSLNFKSIFLEQIYLFRLYLTAQLLRDYMGSSRTRTARAPLGKIQAGMIQRHRDSPDDRVHDRVYQLYIKMPLVEMMVNAEHVEKRMLFGARSASPLWEAASNKDWRAEADVIRDDRELAETLFKEQPVRPDVVSPRDQREILQAIERMGIKNRKKLSGGGGGRGAVNGTASVSSQRDTVAGDSFIRNIYSAIAGKLKHSNNISGETKHLLEEKVPDSNSGPSTP